MTGRRVALLVNPHAGDGKLVRHAHSLAERIARSGATVEVLRGARPADTARLAYEQVAHGVDSLVVMGGDGMVHAGVNAVAGTATALGVIACGTGNDFARAVGLPVHDPVAAADLIAAGQVTRLDLARIEHDPGPGGRARPQRWVASVLAVGFDSRVADRARRMRVLSGHVRYLACVAGELRVFRRTPMRLLLDGREVSGDRLLVAVGNTAGYGGGLQMCAGANPTDGLLRVVEVADATRLDLIRMFGRLYRGTHLGHRSITVHDVREVRLENLSGERLVPVGDGEPVGELPMTVRAVPGALRLHTGASDLHAAPATG